ncbi:hypothetical protein [Streptomyces sp. CRN 30]|uniref:hypothetical protein n=1 Tax=Streptomyces sp. CRN 30 TaxID=3075613 RepID=UPI002A835F3D|nr:hypothetical protein [Streptomyces sp. CRN 30]
MSLWNGRRSRRRPPATAPDGGPGQGTARPAPAGGTGPRVLVEDHDGLLLLRPPTDDTLVTADIADLARALRARNDGTVTVVAVAGNDAAAGLWERLSEVLDSLREAGTRSVRLVMSRAGDDRPGRPAPARRIADGWGLEVEAPDGPVLVVPGGSVFVPPGDGDWWRFAPGKEPEALGPRTPAPDWHDALRDAPLRTADGCVVDRIPAGLLVRPAEATAPRPGDLFHAVPVDPRRPAVVVGVPWGEDVLPGEVAEVLATLPAAVRTGVRLVPGGRRDLLPLGQAVAGLLNTEVEVTTGLPLFAADSPLGAYGVRSVLAGTDGEPRWLPFVDAVLCLPPKPAGAGAGPASGPVPDDGASSRPVPAPLPRLLRWSVPLPDPRDTEDGVLLLSDTWRATVTRAGLWVDRRGGPVPPRSARPVAVEGPTVEIGTAGERLDASLWPVLSRLLGRLSPDLRARTALHVHGTPTDGGLALRTLAADQGLRVIRFTTTTTTARAATATAGSRPGSRPGARQEAGSGSGPDGAAPTPTPTPGPGPGPRTAGVPSLSAPPPAAATPATPATTATPAASATGSGGDGDGGDDGERGDGTTAETDEAAAGEEKGASAGMPEPGGPGGPGASAASTPSAASAASAEQSDVSLPDAPLPDVPVTPRHRGSVIERASFRSLMDPEWDRQSDAVQPVLDGLDGLDRLSEAEREAARVDLIAVRTYLRDDGGPHDHTDLTKSLRAGEKRFLSYAGCLASGLARLPAHRGAVVRGPGGPATPAALAGVRPGAVLRDPAPLSCLPLAPGEEPVAGVGYAIWSLTGRRVRGLRADGDEVVFAPGTAFKVLAVRSDSPAPLVLLRQLPDVPTESTVLDDVDETALARLDHVLAGRTAPGPGDWPDRCAGPVGVH